MLALPETLTLAQANDAVRSIEHQLAQAGTAPDAFVIDAGSMRNFDTAAIAVLLEARRLAKAGGREIEVRGAPPGMVALAGLYGVGGLLGLAPESQPASHSALT